MITQVPKAESDSKAIIEELNDQVASYIGLLDESDDIIKKVNMHILSNVRIVCIICMCMCGLLSI